MKTLESNTGVKFSFNPDQPNDWDIFDAASGVQIGSIAVDDDNMFVGANIEHEYQRTGIATKVIRYLVEEYDVSFFFWPPDGQTYPDARNLSVEGAKWANTLVKKKLARWIKIDPYYEEF